MGKGGGGGPSLAETEASQMRIMNAQMAISNTQTVEAEARMNAQREKERLAERTRLEDAKKTEAEKLVEKNKQEASATSEILADTTQDTEKNINLDSPVIETPDYLKTEDRPV